MKSEEMSIESFAEDGCPDIGHELVPTLRHQNNGLDLYGAFPKVPDQPEQRRVIKVTFVYS